MEHTKPEEPRPCVGIGIMVLKDGKVLLGRRCGSHGMGEYSFPGGHLEYMESFAACAKRETKEECGIRIKNIRFLNVENLTHYAPRHFVTVGFVADWEKGEPETREPDKFVSWGWYALDRLPSPLFVPTQAMIEAYRNGTNYRDTDRVVP